MDRIEKAKELIEGARKLGLQLGFDSGFVIAKDPMAGDPTALEVMIGRIMKYLPEVRSLIEGRARADCARRFLGKRIWMAEYGEGSLEDVTSDGVPMISVNLGFGSKQTRMTADAKSLLIVTDQDAPSELAALNADHTVEKPQRRSVLDRLRGASSGSKVVSKEEEA